MKLFELHIRGKDRFGYDDVESALSWRGRMNDFVRVKTSLSGVTLIVDRVDDTFEVVIFDRNDKVGFIDFVRPKPLRISTPSKNADWRSGVVHFNKKAWTPHSGIREGYSGRGYTSAVYRWFLDAGHSLVTGHEQTDASNLLWRSLSRTYPVIFFNNETGKQIDNPSTEVALKPETRMALLGPGMKSLKDLLE